MEPTTDLLKAYRTDQLRRNLSPKSSLERERSIRLFMAWVEPTALLDVTHADVDAWLDSRGVSPRTWRWHLSNLACFYHWALLAGHTDHNPTVRASRPRVSRLLPRPWAEDDFARAVREAPPRTRCFLLLAGFAGLRCCEIAGLRRDHLLDSASPPMLMVHAGKGGHQRIVPLHPAILAALRSYGLPKRGWVFPGRCGPLRASTVSNCINAFLHGIGIDATAHRGRHHFATACYQAKRDLRLVQELLGHCSPATTAIYAAWDQADAVDVVTSLRLGGDDAA